MYWYVLLLIPIAFAVSLPATWGARALGRRVNAMDSAGVAGQVKMPLRRVPNTGGIGLFLGIALPLVAVLAGAWIVDDETARRLVPTAAAHLAGVREKTSLAVLLLGCLLGLHVIGVVDDRRALGPGVKFFVMFAAATAIALFESGKPGEADNRLLSMLDAYVGGSWLSVVLTVLWIVAVTNAMNFIDNMDGLSAGVGSVAAGCFLAAALLQGQWFIAACLAVLMGALLGFLWFNRPPASVFMGDGGSLVLGFLLAFLTVRTTYYVGPESEPSNSPVGLALPNHWYAVFMPIVILAVPLYDMVVVTAIRLAQGRSPLVGDLQHISHRLVRRGLSRPAAVGVIVGFTAVTGLSGVLLAAATPLQAVLIGTQVCLLLVVLAAFEYAADVRGMINSPTPSTAPTPPTAPTTSSIPAYSTLRSPAEAEAGKPSAGTFGERA